jgi:hypothetical protein
MWEQFKKTALLVQTSIVAACVAAYFLTGRQFEAALFFFLVMQVGAVFGAFWGASLRSRIARQRGELPLLRGR